MKANELRIGNLVKHKNHEKPFKVFIIDTTETSFSANIEPVPLTEEWLVKFGFEKRVQDVCDYFYIGHNNVTHDWLFDLVWLKNSLTDKYEELPFYKNGRHEIKYVHQLQNLYFALTGEELVCQ